MGRRSREDEKGVLGEESAPESVGEVCPVCGGTGLVHRTAARTERCPACKGTGRVLKVIE